MLKKLLLGMFVALAPALAPAQVTVSPLLQPKQFFVDSSNAGVPCAGCSLYSYAAGTTTPQPTFTDSTGTAQNTNPIVLDTSGQAVIWVEQLSYKFTLVSAVGTTLWTVDNVNGGAGNLPTGCTSPGVGWVDCSNELSVNQPITGNAFTMEPLSTIPNPWTEDVTSPCTALDSLTNGTCSAAGITIPITESVVNVQPGQTIAAAVALLPSTGGSVFVPTGTFASGTTTTPITMSNVTILGAGMPYPNSPNKALTAGSGTVIQGQLYFSGASNVQVSNLGIDVGDTFNNCTQDGVIVQPALDSIGSPMLYNVSLWNLVVLGCDHTFAPTSTQHDVRVEHATGLFESNIYTYEGFYGNVVKAINADIVGLNLFGAYSYSSIIKSDDTQGVSANVHVTGMNIAGGGCFAIDTFGGTVSDVTVDGLKIFNTSGTCTNGIQGHIVTDPGTSVPGLITGVKFGKTTIDTTTSDAISFQAGSTNVSFYDTTLRNITGNGLVFQDTSAGSQNSADGLKCTTVSGACFYSFGGSDFINNVQCNTVTGACLENSGSGAVLTAGLVNAFGGTVYTALAGASLGADYIPGGLLTNYLFSPPSTFMTVRPGTSATSYFLVQDPTGVTNEMRVDTTGSLMMNGAIRPGAITVASLPASSTSFGQIRLVSDSTTITAEGQTCVGGGTLISMAFANGSVWKCF